MKVFVFAVRDAAVDAFMTPFFSQSLGGAERAFGDAVNDPSAPMNKHPEHYELYQLGTFDDGAGVFEVGQPRSVCHASKYYKGPAVSPVSNAGVQRDLLS